MRRYWRNDVASVPWRGLLAAVAILLVGGWAADAAKGEAGFAYIPWVAAHPVATAVLLVAALVVAVWQVFLQRRRLISVGTLVQGKVEPHCALILPLSPAGADVEPHDGGGIRVHRATIAGSETVVLTGTDLAADIVRLDELGTWPWQQLLRAIEPHREGLRHLFLLGSSGKGGSHADLERARTLLAPYLADDAVIHPPPDRGSGVDFEDVRKLLDAFHHAVEVLTAQRDPRTGRRIRERDVVVDVTGGLKPTSIAGALVTLSSAVTFQYVHRLSRDEFEVRGYDLLHRGGGEV